MSSRRGPEGPLWLRVVAYQVPVAIGIYGVAVGVSGSVGSTLPVLFALVGFIAAFAALERHLWRWPPRGGYLPMPLIAAAVAFAATWGVQRALRPAPPYTVRLFNVDDHESVFVDGHLVASAGFLDDRPFRLGHLSTSSRITFVVTNDLSGYAWGIQLTRGSRKLYCERAGHAGVVGGGAFGNDGTHLNQVIRRLTVDQAGRVRERWLVHGEDLALIERC